MKVSIVIPVYNEIGTIGEIVSRVQAAPLELEKEIIIVDDGSIDGTRLRLNEFSCSNNVKVIYHERNQGKGAALRTGFKQVSGDIVIIQDADLEYDPREYQVLLQPILVSRADVVYGSRFLGGPWFYIPNALALGIFVFDLYSIMTDRILTMYGGK